MSRFWPPEPVEYVTDQEPVRFWDATHAAQLEAEERRERDYADLEAAARDFVQTYGPAAMLRCVSDALK